MKKFYSIKSLIGLFILTSMFALQAPVAKAQSQCQANFTFNAIGGTTIVQFYDSSSTSSGTITGWSWDFGDGGSASQSQPSHTYNTVGTYQVCLTITTSLGCTSTMCHNVTIGTGCNMSATIAYDSLANTLTVMASGGAPPYNYNWSNGATTTVITVNPSGTYCVTVTDTMGCVASPCYTFQNGTCNALFSYNISGSDVYFFNLSTGNYTSFLWVFGDGTTSTLMNPVHTYTNGVWTPCLNLYDNNGNLCTQYCNVVTVNGGGGGSDTLCGNLFNDINGNGVMDGSDTPIQQGLVYIYGNGISYTATSDGNGHYYAIVPPGTYWVYYCTQTGNTFTVPLNADSSGCAMYQVTVTAGQNLCGLDFGVQYTSVTIEGTVFNDANNNGILDGGETGIPYQYVQVGTWYAYTDANGNYSINIAAGTYNVSYTPSGPYAGYSLTTPGTISVSATTIGNTYGGNNFGIYIIPGSVNLSIMIIPHTTVTPGFPAWYDLQVCNIGATPTGADVTMNYDPALVFSYASPTQATLNATTHQITWTLPLIAPGNCEYIYVDFNALSTINVGDNTMEFASVYPTSGIDIDLSNNTDSIHQIVTSSWDPNNKLSVQTNNANPTEQVVSSQNADQWIEYTINFQNTGTSPAVNIMLLDDLSADLDASTFQLIGTSHACAVNRNASSVSYNFSNIMLPPSTVNEPLSHGFVAFRVKSVNGLAVGHVISDNAAIYFDFNAAVITNYANVTMVNTLGINSPEGNTGSLNVYPNPASGNASIGYSLERDADVTMELIDMSGKKAMDLVNANQSAGKYTVQWNAAALQQGMYVLRMVMNGNVSFSKVNVVR